MFALTQNVGRVRWWATGLLVLGVPAAVAVAGVTWLAEWALGPAGLFFPLSTPFFDGSGLLPVAHLLLAFSVSAAAGLVARNALVAVAVGVGVLLVVQIVLPLTVREHYAAPVTVRGAAAVVDSVELQGRRTLGERYFSVDGRPVAQVAVGPCPPDESGSVCLGERGVTEVEVIYQPASRYWPFQGIEAGILGGLAAIGVGAAFVGLRRRVW